MLLVPYVASPWTQPKAGTDPVTEENSTACDRGGLGGVRPSPPYQGEQMSLASPVRTAPVGGVGAMSSGGASPISGCGVGCGEEVVEAERCSKEAKD